MNDAAATIETHGLAKTYGATPALAGLDLAVRPGETLALLGHNGAGKTTLMRLLLGIARPSGGTVRVLGHTPGDNRAGRRLRRHVGFLPENVAFQEARTGRETLHYLARLKGDRPRANDALLERVGLHEAADQPVRTYSKGMRQRLGLAQALVGNPRLLLLDEPTSGLDPMLRQHFYQEVETLRRAGVSVVLCSHVLTELEARTDRVAILNRGHLTAWDTLDGLRRRAALPVRFRVAHDGGLRPEAADLPAACRVSGQDGNTIWLAAPPDAKMAVLRAVSGHDGVADVDVLPATLDDVYAHFGGGDAVADAEEAA